MRHRWGSRFLIGDFFTDDVDSCPNDGQGNDDTRNFMVLNPDRLCVDARFLPTLCSHRTTLTMHAWTHLLQDKIRACRNGGTITELAVPVL